MPTLDRETSCLLVIDFQSRLMPAIAEGAAVIANARRLLDAAELLGVPALFTEQNADGLGPTIPELRSEAAGLFRKISETLHNTALPVAEVERPLRGSKAVFT